jgi:hypothetical protein
MPAGLALGLRLARLDLSGGYRAGGVWTMKVWTWAVLMVCFVAGGRAAEAADEGAAAWRHVDRRTGAEIRLVRMAPDRVTVDVTLDRLTIRKDISAGRVETRIRSASEDLTLTMSAGSVAVADRKRGTSTVARDAASLAGARRILQQSPVVRRAAAVLGEIEVMAGSPVSHTLLVTQAVLESALGQPGAGGDLRTWVRGARGSARLRTAAVQQEQEERQGSSPTDCWSAYAAEAIAAYIEYEQCVDSEQWWDLPGMLSCLAIYEMRAIGAFSWWVSCVGFRS